MSEHEFEMEAAATAGPSVRFDFQTHPGHESTRTTVTLTFSIEQGNHPNPVKLEAWCVSIDDLVAGTYTAQSCCLTGPVTGSKTLDFRVDSGQPNLVVSCVLVDSATGRQITGVGSSQVIYVPDGANSGTWSVPRVSDWRRPVLTVTNVPGPGPGGGNQSIAIVPTFQTGAVPGEIPTVELEITADPDGAPCHFEVIVAQSDGARSENVTATSIITSTPSSESSTETVQVFLDQPYVIATATMYDANGDSVASDSWVWLENEDRLQGYDVSIEDRGSPPSMTLAE